jgi:EmrB/QacA subfamily drug resistance transporter
MTPLAITDDDTDQHPARQAHRSERDDSMVTRPEPAARRGHHSAVALAVIAASQLMVVLDVTIVNIALPQIQQALGFSTTDLSWVLNAYTLTFGGLLLLGGRAGDILGRRRVFVAGILLFTFASFVGGLATTSGWLLAARALQGVGGAIAAPTALALITTNFAQGRERNRAFGVFAAVAGAGGAIGLLAGGMLTSWLSWRWVLFVNVPIGLLLAMLAPRYLSESARQPGRFDLGGALTSTVGMAALVYGFISAAQDGWSNLTTVGSFAAAVVLLAIFLSIETRTRQPITPLHLFVDRNRAGSYAIMLALSAALVGQFFFLTLFVQDVLGYSPLRAGLAFLPITAAIISSSQLAARSLPRVGPKRLMTAGALLGVVGLAWLSRVSVDSGYLDRILGPTVLFGLGMGLLFVPLTILAVSGCAPARDGGGLQPPQRHAAGRRLPGAVHPSHRLWHRPTRGPGPVPADRPAPHPLGRSGPGPRHLDLVPARGRVRHPGPSRRPGRGPHAHPAGGAGRVVVDRRNGSRSRAAGGAAHRKMPTIWRRSLMSNARSGRAPAARRRGEGKDRIIHTWVWKALRSWWVACRVVRPEYRPV